MAQAAFSWKDPVASSVVLELTVALGLVLICLGFPTTLFLLICIQVRGHSSPFDAVRVAVLAVAALDVAALDVAHDAVPFASCAALACGNCHSQPPPHLPGLPHPAVPPQLRTG